MSNASGWSWWTVPNCTGTFAQQKRSTVVLFCGTWWVKSNAWFTSYGRTQRFSFILAERLRCRFPEDPGDIPELLRCTAAYDTAAALHVFTLLKRVSVGMLDNSVQICVMSMSFHWGFWASDNKWLLKALHKSLKVFSLCHDETQASSRWERPS